MTWWCAATDVAWSWNWRPYPGVWLFVVLLAWVYLWGLARARAQGIEATRWQRVSYFTGVLVLWLATDWPIGALGAGYLLSVHTVQYLLYCMVAPPLLLLGLPRPLVLSAEARPAIWRWLKRLANPLVALLIFNGVLFSSHVPAVVDGFRVSQLGSLIIDLAWLTGGLALWWPVIAPTPEVSRVESPWKAGYLFLSTILPTIPAAFMIYADYPIYRLYELAPRVNDILATTDQLVAGLIMKAGGDVISWIALLIVLVRWARSEAARDRLERRERAPAG